MKKRITFILLIAALVMLAVVPAYAQDDPVELRITWYSDGEEDVPLRDLLDEFEAENPDITVVIDIIGYNNLLENLPTQLQAGEGPDMARVTDLGGLSEYYLDMRPYLEDPEYWEANFGPFLNWLRPEGSDAIPGFMTQLTVTGPFVNKTLFDQAGIEMPGEGATWQDWVDATQAVAEATETPFAMAIDRSGHRMAGPAVSTGATYFDEDGNISLVGDEGFREMSQMIVDWHNNGIMPLEIWVSGQGTYAPATDQFINGEVVLYMAGSWQVGNFANTIGDSFDWVAVPNPCGPAACSGMPGGAALVAIGDTEHPEEVTRVMEFLAQEDSLAEFSARTLFIPGHLGLSESGVEFETDNQLAKDALSVFVSQVAALDPLAFDLQAYPFNRVLWTETPNRLEQVIAGELTLDEAIERIQQDHDEAVAEASS